MEVFEIAVSVRETVGKGAAHRSRREGVVPAVAYGPGIGQAVAISASSREVAKALSRTVGSHGLVTLKLGDKTLEALIKQYQVHPLSRRLLHVDFLVTSPDHDVEVEVPVVTEGKSKGEELGGRQYVARRQIMIRCRPANIPERIVIDVSKMNLNEVMHIDEVALPEGVKPVFKSRFPVVMIEKAKAEDDAVKTSAEAGEPAEGDKKAE